MLKRTIDLRVVDEAGALALRSADDDLPESLAAQLLTAGCTPGDRLALTESAGALEALLVVNMSEPTTLATMLDWAARVLDHSELYYFELDDRRYFKTADGRWFTIAFEAIIDPVDGPICGRCSEEVPPEAVASDGADGNGIVCRSCAAGVAPTSELSR